MAVLEKNQSKDCDLMGREQSVDEKYRGSKGHRMEERLSGMAASGGGLNEATGRGIKFCFFREAGGYVS